MKTGKNGKNEVNTGPQRAQETQWPVNEPFTTAPLPHKNKLLLLLPRRIASRLVYFFSLTINLPIILVRSHSWLWRWAAKLYIFPWDRFAYLNACLVCALSRITVPAYRTFVKSRSHRFWQVFLESYPETNKENYVKSLISQANAGTELSKSRAPQSMNLQDLPARLLIGCALPANCVIFTGISQITFVSNSLPKN